MLDKEELIEDIELFEKLDIKYLLEELDKNSHYDFTNSKQQPIELESEMVELIRQSLILLVQKDDDFAQNVYEASLEVDKQNKVADITVAGVVLGAGVTLLVCLLKGNKDNGGDVYGANHNEGEIDYHLHVDGIDKEEFKTIIKECLDNANAS
ncbi:MAG: hypothetical protein K0U38_11235 [Epsilonproteobacteria bacterium]|nr:hypothetical protein [Campylobacterota bacterium]